jgi:hypothetical protein
MIVSADMIITNNYEQPTSNCSKQSQNKPKRTQFLFAIRGDKAKQSQFWLLQLHRPISVVEELLPAFVTGLNAGFSRLGEMKGNLQDEICGAVEQSTSQGNPHRAGWGLYIRGKQPLIN